MLYDVLKSKIKSLPDSAIAEVLDYVDVLSKKYAAKSAKKTGESSGAFGCLSSYANPSLWKKEQSAWADVVAEKHALR